MKDSAIEWCDDTVNVVEGCDEVDEDCARCFAKGIAARFAEPHKDGTQGHYAGIAKRSGKRRLPQWTGEVRTRIDVLDAMFWRLLRARAPRKQFLCSMGDIFHREVPDAFLDEVFARIAILESRRQPILTTTTVPARPHPIYMLTKRPDRAEGDARAVAGRLSVDRAA